MGTFAGKNALRGTDGYVNVQIGRQQYRVASVQSIKATLDISNTEIKALGTKMVQHKSGMMSGSFEATLHYNVPEFRNMIKAYKESGGSPRFTIWIVNDGSLDNEQSVGSQMVHLDDCLISSLILAELDADADELTEDISGTFDDYGYSTDTSGKAVTFSRTTTTMYKI